MALMPRTPSSWNDQPAAPSLETPPPGPGLLDGWQAPDWSLKRSGLSLLLDPQTIAQIDFGNGRNSAAPANTVKSAAQLDVSPSTPGDGTALDLNGTTPVEQIVVTPHINVRRLGQILGMGEGNYESYNTGTRGVPQGRIGHSYQNPRPGTVTGRTINQILGTENLPGTDPNRMFAVGAYQMVIPTLRDAARALKLTGDERFTPELQDRIFKEFLIPKAGDGTLNNLLTRGEGTVDQAQHAAAHEWASIAVPAGHRTKNRSISNGAMSYYPLPANRANMNATRALRVFLTDLTR